jgi:DHA1 family inner membrane transport protein
MAQTPRQFYAFISITTFTKLLMNVTRRMIYPFAPEFARGLGVELSSITSVIALNQATALLGPVGASFADKYGYKLLMLLSLVFLTIGTFAAGFIPLYSVLMLCLFLAGLAKSIFDPTLQAFIGKYIPFEQRGKVIGITELAWAGSSLMGIPVAGLIIERFSWQTPFWILGILSIVCFGLILKLMPKDPPREKESKKTSPSFLANWKTIIKNREVLGILSFAFFMALASDNLFVIYGAWLEQSYGLGLAAIGFSTILIGISEILGEGMTALFSDRIGLKRSILLGLSLCGGAYFLLPALDIGLSFVLAGLFLIFFFFEFTYVTAMSLTTELVPELRASTMSAFYAIGGIGRVIGAFSGGMIWSSFGLKGISLLSGGCTFIALFCIILGFSKTKKSLSPTL